MKEKYKGIHKANEEAGELVQIIGKLNVFPCGKHPDKNGDLNIRLMDEIADVYAALDYLVENEKDISKVIIRLRRQRKLKKFRKWGLTGINAK